MLAQNKLPFPFNAINVVGGVASRFRNIPNLTVEHIQQAAVEQTGLTDFGDPAYLEGLTILMQATQTDNLNFIGKISMERQAIQFAAVRLLWIEMQKREPERFATPLLPPLIVLGLPRSGTTILHRMLASDPANQAIPLWRMVQPFPPLDGSADNRREWMIEQMNQMKRLTPGIDAKHFISADEPEECMNIQGLSFASPVFYATAPVDSYLEWYVDADQYRAYEEYATMLLWYQSEDGRRLVMKSPSHAPMLPPLLAAVPNALIVQTHRDPVKVVNSMNSLFHTTHSSRMATYDLKGLTERNLWLCSEMMKRNMAQRETLDHNICDIFFDELVGDPIGTARKIYAHFDLEFTDAFEQSLTQYMDNNRRGKHGKHRYQAADFGMTDEQIRAQFAEYIAWLN